MKLLWICDPWKSVNTPRETTLRLIDECIQMGHENWFCDSVSLSIYRGSVKLRASRMVKDRRGKFSLVENKAAMNLAHFSKIFFRCDPPFDVSYFTKVKLIHAEVKRMKLKAKVVNPTNSLLILNSKISCEMLEKRWLVKTLFSCNDDQLVSFGIRNKKVVAKPLSMGANNGIELLYWRTQEEIGQSRRIIKKMTRSFTQHILLQEYKDLFARGEVRVWFAGGKIIASARKTMVTKTFPFSVDKGDRLVKHVLSSREHSVVKRILRFLREQNIQMAAVDILDAKIIDINIGSPGLLVEMEEVWRQNLARKVMQRVLA